MKARLTALAGIVLFTPIFAYAVADPVAEASRLLERGSYRAATEQLSKLAPFAREQVQARFLYATALAGAGEREKAIALFEGLIADYPAQPEPYNNLAALRAAQGQLDLAKEVLERGLRTNASYAAVYDNLSAIYVEMARVSYVKALRVKEVPNTPNLQLLYAMAAPKPEPKPVPAIPAPEMVATIEAPLLQPPQPVEKPPSALPPVSVPSEAPAPPASSETKLPPAKSAEPAPAASPAPSSHGAVTATLQEWARAWSKGEVESYLGYYAADFNPPGSVTRDQWSEKRRERLAAAESISVELEEFQVKMVNAQRAVVNVVQRYSAAHYSDVTRKQFTLVKVEDRWLIRNEKSLGIVR